MQLLSTITVVAVLSAQTATHAFVPRNTQPARTIDTARPVLKNLDVESFLTKAKTDFEKFVNFAPQDVKNKEISAAAKKAAFQHDFQQARADATHQGGDAHYQNPVVSPSKLSMGEECQEIIIDYATGDELCWGESPLDEPKNYKQLEQTPVAQNTAMQYADSISVRDEYHKGGNARYVSDSTPRTLKDSDEECDEQHRFIDFQSGDELCWAD